MSRALSELKELAVLGVIRAHPLHGYALAEALDEGVGPSIGLGRATIYAILRRFEEREWVSVHIEREGTVPERRVLTLTPAGEQAFARLLLQCAEEPQVAVIPLVGLLAYLDELPTQPRAAALDRLLAARREQLDRLERFPAHPGAAGVALELRRDQLRLEIAALERLANSSQP